MFCMTEKPTVLDGISEWIRKQVGPEAENRGDDTPADNDASTAPEGDDNDESSSEYDSPACCSAAANSELTVLDS